MDLRDDQFEEQEGYLASVSDLMVGFLFIFIIILMSVALRMKVASDDLQDIQDEHEGVVQQLTSDRKNRAALLNEIKAALEARGVLVRLTPREDGILLPEETLFQRGLFQLDESGLDAVAQLAEEMMRVLPCVLHGAQRSYCPKANQRSQVRLESIQVEGHSDSTPVGRGAPYRSNWELSHLRAESTFRGLLAAQPRLDQLQNVDEESLFSMGAYGETRPLARPNGQALDDWHAANRRIEVRFNLASPDPREAAVPRRVSSEG